MIAAATQSLRPSRLTQQLQAVMLSETLDDFASGCRSVLQAAAVPFHSLMVSFNELESFFPWLVRDTMPRKADAARVVERYARLNPTIHFLRNNPGVSHSLFNDQVRAMPAAKWRSYQQCFRRHEGWSHYAEIHFWCAKTLQATICVRRSPAQPDFSKAELRIFAELRAALAGCISRLHRQHRERLTGHCLQNVLIKLPVAILVLDWSLKINFMNLAARKACANWLHGADRARALKASLISPIPDEIIAACEMERKRLQSTGFSPLAADVDNGLRSQEVRHGTREGISARVEVIEWAKIINAMPGFLVRFHVAGNPAVAASVASDASSDGLALLACLTPCEREIALSVRTGMTNREIATRYFKSAATVRAQLRSIFRKLGVSNRTKVAMMLRQI